MIISVLDEFQVLGLAMALVAGAGKNGPNKIKKLLRAAEAECDCDQVRELIQNCRMKITQMEDQWDGDV